MTTTVEKNKTAVHVGGTGDSPYRAAFQAVEAHTHTLQTVSCIVSRGPSHNLHSQTATVLMPFQYANFRLRVSVLFFCIHIYIPSSPRFGEKKNVPQTSPSFEWCIQDHTQNNLAIEKKKGNRSGPTCDVRSYKVLSMHRLVHQKQHVLRTHTPGKTKNKREHSYSVQMCIPTWGKKK